MNQFILSTPAFNGTAQLLLHLVREDQMKVEDLSLSGLLDQFMNYISYLEKISLDEAGEFLVIAALLMRMKVTQLLPVVKEEGDQEPDQNSFLRNLEEYRKFKEVAVTLKEKEQERRLLFDRGFVPDEPESGGEELIDASLYDLLEALRAILPGLSDTEPMTVSGEEISIEEKMELILQRIKDEGSVEFVNLLGASLGRRHVVVTFVALLELIRLGLVKAKQRKLFADITIVMGRTLPDRANNEEVTPDVP